MGLAIQEASFPVNYSVETGSKCTLAVELQD